MNLKRRFSLRDKLTVATVLPLFIAIVICSLIGFFILVAKIGSQAQDKVRSDLNAGLEIYQNEIEHLHDVVRFTASAPYVSQALARGDSAELAGVLRPLMQSEQLDIFTAVDARGVVLLRARSPENAGDDLAADLLTRRALAGRDTFGTTVVPAARLAREGDDLVRRAVIRVIPTEQAAPVHQNREMAGMFMVAATPVRDREGNVIGALIGGVLLNNDNRLVDRIRQVLYQGESRADDNGGGATIFLNDLRIATTVTTADRHRVIGTKLSTAVYNRVVLMKERWIGRAFVVNDWYFSGYEPILSLEGVPIGALYVGMLEKPFTRLKLQMTVLVMGVLLFGALMGTWVAHALSVRLARPIKELEKLAGRVAAGERGLGIATASDDEIGDLAVAFNRMSAALTGQEEEIRTLNRGLEEKVLQRTAELEEKNLLLQRAQGELVRVEKLAAIGELAAGVAHEINNPLAIIRGNAELLQMSLPGSAPQQEEVEIISRQVGRMERIVANLLTFARHEQKRCGPVSLHAIIAEVLDQVGHQVSLERIDVCRQFTAGPLEIVADGDRLRQVFTNLVVNAIQAMPAGGRLTVSTDIDAAAGACSVTVADTGVGIPAEQLGQIFDPFVTGRADGTGLGLSVSYGIVRDHGGRIDVESSVGAGSRFRVTLPTGTAPGEPVPAPVTALSGSSPDTEHR